MPDEVQHESMVDMESSERRIVHIRERTAMREEAVISTGDKEVDIHYGYALQFRDGETRQIPSANFAHAYGSGQVLSYKQGLELALPQQRPIILTPNTVNALIRIFTRMLNVERFEGDEPDQNDTGE